MTFEEYVNNLKRKITNKDNLLFVCIGNSNILWDSIGPLVGSNLKKSIGKKLVIGDLEKNICNKTDLIYYYPRLKNKFIIAIDTALTQINLYEEIFITNAPIIMGKAFNKNKGTVGNIGIKIAISDIKNVNYNYVKYMENFISKGITKIFLDI